MHIDPHSSEGLRFIADHLGCAPSELTCEDVLIFEHDECQTCMTCGKLFTDRHDFDLDILDATGERVCADDCSGSDRAEDVIDFHREHGTYRARFGSVVG